MELRLVPQILNAARADNVRGNGGAEFGRVAFHSFPRDRGNKHGIRRLVSKAVPNRFGFGESRQLPGIKKHAHPLNGKTVQVFAGNECPQPLV